MRKTLLLAALLLPFAAGAQAEDAAPAHPATRMSKVDGNKLLSICTAKSATLVQGCEAYIDGVADTIGVYQHLADAPNTKITLDDRTCIPGNATGVQLRDTVVAFLKSHSADRARFAALIVQHALHEAFPCK